MPRPSPRRLSRQDVVVAADERRAHAARRATPALSAAPRPALISWTIRTSGPAARTLRALPRTRPPTLIYQDRLPRVVALRQDAVHGLSRGSAARCYGHDHGQERTIRWAKCRRAAPAATTRLAPGSRFDRIATRHRRCPARGRT